MDFKRFYSKVSNAALVSSSILFLSCSDPSSKHLFEDDFWNNRSLGVYCNRILGYSESLSFCSEREFHIYPSGWHPGSGSGRSEGFYAIYKDDAIVYDEVSKKYILDFPEDTLFAVPIRGPSILKSDSMNIQDEGLWYEETYKLFNEAVNSLNNNSYCNNYGECYVRKHPGLD